MRQPELGQQLAQLRQEKNMTQEELVEACNVSVRTIQRIESGEVTPRVSTVKILVAALGSDMENFDQPKKDHSFKTSNGIYLRAGWIAGIVYLVIGSIEMTADYVRMMGEALHVGLDDLNFNMSYPIWAFLAISYKGYIPNILYTLPIRNHYNSRFIQ